jgi:hypothetical protein
MIVLSDTAPLEFSFGISSAGMQHGGVEPAMRSAILMTRMPPSPASMADRCQHRAMPDVDSVDTCFLLYAPEALPCSRRAACHPKPTRLPSAAPRRSCFCRRFRVCPILQRDAHDSAPLIPQRYVTQTAACLC